MRVLYLASRYLPFISILLFCCHQFGQGLDQASCKAVYIAVTSSFLVSICTSDLISAMGVWVMWGKGRKLAYFLFGALASVWMAFIALTVLYLKFTLYFASPTPPLVGCVLINARSYILSIFALSWVFSGVMLAVVVTRVVVASRKREVSHLLQVLCRDGSIYYIWIFGLEMLNVVIMARLPDDYLLLVVVLDQAVHSVLACRIILNIREQHRLKTGSQDNIKGAEV